MNATREASQPRSISIDAALDTVGEHKGLVVLADWADNPGGGISIANTKV